MKLTQRSTMSSVILFALFQLAMYIAMSDLEGIGALAQSTKCVACPPTGQTGDSRCKLSAKTSVTSPISGCPSCGCQKCPDGKIYANAATNYCLASPSTTCGSKPTCRISCLVDDRCSMLPYDDDLNPNAISCLCPCQKCPDGKTYKTNDWLKSQPLTLAEEKQCPNILYPIQPIQNLCS